MGSSVATVWERLRLIRGRRCSGVGGVEEMDGEQSRCKVAGGNSVVDAASCILCPKGLLSVRSECGGGSGGGRVEGGRWM